jgi:hypothetical protein
MSLHSAGDGALTKKLTNFRIDSELIDGLQEVRDRDGIPVSEQVRRAIAAWLRLKGVVAKKKTAPRRVVAPRKA